MAQFIVHGPRDVPVQRNAGGRVLTSAHARQFWEENPDIADARGCYVFGIRSGGGTIPAYVGKATKCFGQEVFTPHKRAKYMEAMSQYVKGSPVLFFACLPVTSGAPNRSQIDELESFLIQAGMERNWDLLNERKTRTEAWSIRGVLRCGKGKPNWEAREFGAMMAL